MFYKMNTVIIKFDGAKVRLKRASVKSQKFVCILKKSLLYYKSFFFELFLRKNENICRMQLPKSANLQKS